MIVVGLAVPAPLQNGLVAIAHGTCAIATIALFHNLKPQLIICCGYQYVKTTSVRCVSYFCSDIYVSYNTKLGLKRSLLSFHKDIQSKQPNPINGWFCTTVTT